eukprot:Skav214137  [mRNA]  locus=scaffold1185:768268:769287:- [translate_table: standard]
MKDNNGVAQAPLVNTLIRDMETHGHSFTFLKVDANGYLLPQRRNRVFGCSSSVGSKTPQEIEGEQQKWREVFARLGCGPTEQQFSLEDILESGHDVKPLQAPQDLKNWKLVLARVKRTKGADPNATICLCMGSSEARLEYMINASTRVRPPHDVRCNLVERPLVGCELLRLQGSFPDDYPHPEAVQNLSQPLARDLAGNAFPTTVLQADFIASLIAHEAWDRVASRQNFASPKQVPRQKRNRKVRTDEPAKDDEKDLEIPGSKKNRKRPFDDGDGILGSCRAWAVSGDCSRASQLLIEVGKKPVPVVIHNIQVEERDIYIYIYIFSHIHHMNVYALYVL